MSIRQVITQGLGFLNSAKYLITHGFGNFETTGAITATGGFAFDGTGDLKGAGNLSATGGISFSGTGTMGASGALIASGGLAFSGFGAVVRTGVTVDISVMDLDAPNSTMPFTASTAVGLSAATAYHRDWPERIGATNITRGYLPASDPDNATYDYVNSPILWNKLQGANQLQINNIGGATDIILLGTNYYIASTDASANQFILLGHSGSAPVDKAKWDVDTAVQWYADNVELQFGNVLGTPDAKIYGDGTNLLICGGASGSKLKFMEFGYPGGILGSDFYHVSSSGLRIDPLASQLGIGVNPASGIMLKVGGKITSDNVTDATDKDTGSIVTEGGIAAEKAIFSGSSIIATTSYKVGANQVVGARGAALTAQLTTVTHTAPGTPDYAVQDLTAIGGYGFVTKDEGNTVLSVIANLQARVAELEARLGSSTGHGLFT